MWTKISFPSIHGNRHVSIIQSNRSNSSRLLIDVAIYWSIFVFESIETHTHQVDVSTDVFSSRLISHRLSLNNVVYLLNGRRANASVEPVCDFWTSQLKFDSVTDEENRIFSFEKKNRKKMNRQVNREKENSFLVVQKVRRCLFDDISNIIQIIFEISRRWNNRLTRIESFRKRSLTSFLSWRLFSCSQRNPFEESSTRLWTEVTVNSLQSILESFIEITVEKWIRNGRDHADQKSKRQIFRQIVAFLGTNWLN